MGIARPVIAVYPAAWIYFVSFVILSAFIMMNVVVGIIVNTIQSTHEDVIEEDLNKSPRDIESENLENLLSQLKKTEEMVEQLLKSKRVSSRLSRISLPVMGMVSPKEELIVQELKDHPSPSNNQN